MQHTPRRGAESWTVQRSGRWGQVQWAQRAGRAGARPGVPSLASLDGGTERRSWKDRRVVRRIGYSGRAVMGDRRESADRRLHAYAHLTARRRNAAQVHHVGCVVLQCPGGLPRRLAVAALRHLQLRQDAAADWLAGWLAGDGCRALQTQAERVPRCRARNVTARLPRCPGVQASR